MTSIPYSTKPIPTIGELRNVQINPATLVNGQVVSYNAIKSVWENTAGGGGGGGATITGTDDAVVFKNGANGDAVSNGITKNTALNGYTASLDTTNKRVAINHTAGAITETFEVNGTASFTDNLQTIKISEQRIGLTSAAPNELKLYSANLPAVVDGLTTIDSVAKKTGSSAFRSLNPTNFDVANTTDEDSIYKIKLETGTLRQSVPTPAFDIQEAFRPLAFPTGQIVEYSNKLPLQKPIIISRNLGPQTIAPASVRVVTAFGLRRNAPFFDDGMTYDPCNMRAKLTGNGWNSAGAPVAYRVADLKLGFTISWNIHGTWTGGGGGPLHRGDVYVVQYRNGVVLYNHLVQQLEQEGEIWFVGKKTFLGWDVGAGEDFDPLTDYYEVELTNQGGVDLTYNSAQVEIECWLAQ